MQINKINYLEYKKQQKQNTSFKGIGEAATAVAGLIPRGLQAVDANPIVRVGVIDLFSMIIPRTWMDAKRTNEKGEKNGFAAVETFARESMGLVVNCLSPAIVALGLRSAINNSVMGKEFKGKGLHLNKFLGDAKAIDNAQRAWELAEESIDDGTKEWAKKKGFAETSKEVKIRQSVKNIFKDIEGLSGSKTVKFTDIAKEQRTKIYDLITDEILNLEKSGKANFGRKTIGKIQKTIVEELGASRNIRYTWEGAKAGFNYTVNDIVRDGSFMVKTFANKAITPEKRASFVQQSKKLLERSGLSGMLVIMGIGLGTQKVNRLITEKRSGKKGFPGYKDFNKEGGLDLSTKEKRNLIIQKAVAASAMIGLALATIKKPSVAKLSQFRGWFPTIDQAKIISATTYTGRLLAADDTNELKESGIRDVLGLVSLYVLGDYITKGYATLAKKINPKLDLVHISEPLKPNANKGQQFVHWITKVSMRANEEIASKRLRNTRSWIEAGSIATSMVLLGILLPKFNIWMTEKSKAKRAVKQQNAIMNPSLSMMSNAHMTNKTKDLFKAFTK